MLKASQAAVDALFLLNVGSTARAAKGVCRGSPKKKNPNHGVVAGL